MLTYREYIEYAERLSLQASTDTPEIQWPLIPATILAWAAIESFVNNMLDDFASLPPDMFELHERAFLLEKRLQFVDHGNNTGKFSLEGQEYRRLGDKILFLIAKFSGDEVKNIKGETLWQRFELFKNARDGLVHPRRNIDISLDVDTVESFIDTAKEIIQLVSRNVWKQEITF